MSDVTVAPNAALPSAPAANEVVINQNPTGSPQPVGSQAPDKPVGDIKGSEHRPMSRREAIQKAFERANTPERREATKPRQAKAGDNNPPEDTPKLDLKKRPADQPKRERGEHGHFAPREQPDADGAPQARQQQAADQQRAQQAKPAEQLSDTAPYREPLQRMTDRAKAEWGSTPESVRADVHRMHQEFDGAYRRYRTDHETMNGIRNFEQMAAQHGTTLQRALTNYVGMEHKLRTDVVGGLDTIVNNLNLRAPDGRKITLQDIAHHILTRTPDQQKLMQSQNVQMAQSHQLQQMAERQAGLENQLARMQHVEQFRHTRGAVDQYAEDHPRFDELADLIENEIKFGFDLDTAYRRAELLRPARAAQTRNGNGTAAQTRASDRSISGAPDGGTSSNGASRGKGGKPVGRRTAIQNAIKRVNGSL